MNKLCKHFISVITALSLTMFFAVMDVSANELTFSEMNITSVESETTVTPTPRLAALTPGTYYCLSSSRTDAYINIASDKATVTFYKVYFLSVKNYINGSGSHTYTGGDNSFEFYTNTTWKYSNGTSGNGTILAIDATLVDGEFLMVNGEIYSRG